MTDLSELLERVRGAASGTRQLDHHIEAGLRCAKDMTDWGVHANAREWLAGAERKDFGVPPYSTSIDTSVKAVGVFYPDGWIDMNATRNSATAKICFEGNRAYWSNESPTLPLAIVDALLSALQSQAGK